MSGSVGGALAERNRAFSRALLGMEAPAVTVETHLPGGLPAFTLVGLPETAVREARDRVKSAIQNCGLDFPQGRVVVNLAPADLVKEGARFDLAIAVSILCATGQLPHQRTVRNSNSSASSACSANCAPCAAASVPRLPCGRHRTAGGAS